MPKLPILAAAGTRRRWTSTDARLVLKALAASGLSVNAFATQQGLDAQRLYFWRRRLETEPRDLQTPRFVEVVARSAAPVEVVLRSGRILRISSAIDTPTLRRLVEAFEDDAGC
jgi:transposase-like protein